jgi:hypothetical protein
MMSAPGDQNRGPFFLHTAAGPVDEPIIALWRAAPAGDIPTSAQGELAAPAAPSELDRPIWRVVLPANVAEARSILEGGGRTLAEEEQALTRTYSRLELLAGDLGRSGPHNLRGPDAELVASLVQSGSVGAVSFDVETGSTAGLADRAGDWLRETWDGLGALVARTTWTETEIEGRLIARSALGRTGDTLTAWIDGVTDEEASLHNRAVQLALASKQALLRKVSLVIKGALMITGFVAAPGSALLAIPAIWRYLNQLRAELTGD